MDSTQENKWFLAIKKNERDFLNPRMSEFKRHTTPYGQYEADPFLIKHNGVNYVFYELYDYNKGIIAYSVIQGLDLVGQVEVLELPYHISYPCIFKWGKNIYMIPETGLKFNIQLYVATDFPNKWELIKVIWHEGWSTADNTILRHNDAWWLFVSWGAENNLIILRADELTGEWKLHFRGNFPHSRSAGRIFKFKGDIIRPVQKQGDSVYGEGMLFKKIQLPDYKEELIDLEIKPDWYPGLIGTHTYNFNSDYIVIDGKIRV